MYRLLSSHAHYALALLHASNALRNVLLQLYAELMSEFFFYYLLVADLANNAYLVLKGMSFFY